MRKGNQVKLIGKYPFCGNDGIVKYRWEKIYRHVTAEEVQEWKSKLSEDTFTVVRARCAPRLSYGRKWAGMTLVRNDRTGEEGYIKRTEIQLITCNTKQNIV